MNSYADHIETPERYFIIVIHLFCARTQSLDGEVKVVMEATDLYRLPLFDHLKQGEIFVSVINPIAMKKYANAGFRKGKTDRSDALRNANYGINN